MGRSRCYVSDSDSSKPWSSAIVKAPVEGAVFVNETGIDGDEQSDPEHHGGRDKAVLAYAVSHYAFWNSRHQITKFEPGGFGENLTVSGLDETTCCIGDVFEIGSCLFEVSQPRQPCWKLSRRWEIPTLAQEVQDERRTGWYLRVLRAGQLNIGDRIQLRERRHPEFTIARALAIMYAKPRDSDDDLQLAKLPQLSESWKNSLESRSTRSTHASEAKRLSG